MPQEFWILDILIAFKLSRFYWNLGLLENALRELDQLDAFLSGLIWDLSLETTAKDSHKPFQWLKQIKLLPFGKQCPLLGAAIYLNSTTDQMSLVEWRCFILAQQVLLTFHMFHERLDLIEEQQERDRHNQQAPKDEEVKQGISEDLAQSLRSNFVTFILRYTHDCLMRITEEVIVLKANYSPSLLYMLSLVWHAEVFRVCDYLVDDVLRVDTASYYICQMTYLHCNAVVELVPFLSSTTLNHNDCTIARRWLECTPTQQLDEPSAEVFAQLCGVLLLDTTNATITTPFATFAEECLKRGVEIFGLFNWHRHSELFNSKLAELLGKHDRRAAFKCLQQNADNHFNGNGNSTEFMVQYADRLMEEYEDLLGDDEFTLSCYLTLLLSNSNQSSSKNNEKFVSLLERMALSNRHMYRSSLDWKWPLTLPIHIRSIAENLLLSVLNSPIQLELDLVSDFPTSLSQCQVKAVFRPVSADVLQPLEPTFYSSTISDNVCRFACVSKGGRSASSSSQVDDYLVLTSKTDCSLVGSGSVSRVQLQGKATVPGCFALDHLEVTIAKALTFHLHYQKEMVRGGSRLENVLCLVDIKKPWVVMEPAGANTQFLAGVVQKMCFRVHTGTMAMDSPSPLKFCLVGLKPLMEFMTQDGRWNKELNVQVVPLNADQSQLVEVFMCLAIDRMNFSADQSSLLHHEVQVDWVGRSWHFP